VEVGQTGRSAKREGMPGKGWGGAAAIAVLQLPQSQLSPCHRVWVAAAAVVSVSQSPQPSLLLAPPLHVNARRDTKEGGSKWR